MTHRESEQYRLELTEIIKELPKEVGECLPEGLKDRLLDIARKVGASTRSARINDNGQRIVYNASIEDLISNVYQALDTASIIEACRISARSSWISLVATIISLLAMVAAWVVAWIAVLAK
ncbi:MAG: hypothetical protein A2168_05790 [Planctomycetes bacterium RBG_13_50_24]|nr:MAG: hypothetical protein A2168_05790 [Planctomycetes bacterium RBG_13_50_24]